LQLLGVKEAQANAFVNPPWKRWLAKLELFGRGFSFGDGEVMARLLDAVFEGVREHFAGLIQLMGDLEFYLGALGMRDRARAAGLETCLPNWSTKASPERWRVCSTRCSCSKGAGPPRAGYVPAWRRESAVAG
jgi:DNA mismatch repair protein MutS2